MTGEILRLELEGDDLVGELAIAVPPGTTAAVRDRAIDALLASRLGDLAAANQVVVGAAPSRFVHPRPGKDDSGRTRFDVRGKVEADRLVPQRPKKKE